LPLGLHRDIPDRQADEPFASLRIEHRPFDDRWLVRVVRIEQHTTKGRLVRLAADVDRPRFACCPNPGGTVGGLDRSIIEHPHNLLYLESPNRPAASPIAKGRRERLSRAVPSFLSRPRG